MQVLGHFTIFLTLFFKEKFFFHNNTNNTNNFYHENKLLVFKINSELYKKNAREDNPL